MAGENVCNSALSFDHDQEDLTHESSFYSEIFNKKQKIFSLWLLIEEFSEYNLNYLVSKCKKKEFVDKCIRQELGILMGSFYPDEKIDPRRFVNIYRKWLKQGVNKTATIPNTLYFLLSGMIQYKKISLLHKEDYINNFSNWPALFLPDEIELEDKANKGLIETELNKFRNDIQLKFRKCFEIPPPTIRSYQGFIFSANFLFEFLHYDCPQRREKRFAVFSLLTFKSIFNLCFLLPFEYSILHNIAYNDYFLKLKKKAKAQKDIVNGDFLETLLNGIISEFEIPFKGKITGTEDFKIPDGYIKELTCDFSQDKLDSLAKNISERCADDCNGLIYSLLRQAAIGLALSERTDDKKLLTSLLQRDQEEFPDSDLPLILYLIASGLNRYSTAIACKNTRNATETKKAKKAKNIVR